MYYHKQPGKNIQTRTAGKEPYQNPGCSANPQDDKGPGRRSQRRKGVMPVAHHQERKL